jgi:YD repeat-containing protein
MSILNELQNRQGETQEELFKYFLGNLDILDFGSVLNMYERRADDASACAGFYVDVQALDGRVLENVELLAPGAADAVLFCAPTPGDAVLLVGLKRQVTSVETGGQYPAGLFCAENLKALPLGKPGRSTLQLLMGGCLAFVHKHGAFGLDASGELFSRSINQAGDVTRDERCYPDGSTVKCFHAGRAVTHRNADGSTERFLYDENMRILEYERHDMTGAQTVKTGENTDRNTAFADKQWKYERTSNIEPAYEFDETVKDTDGKILRRCTIDADGSLVYSYFEQSESGADFLATQTLHADGSYERILSNTDGTIVHKISIGADGSTRLVTGDNAVDLHLQQDGSATCNCSGNITVTGGKKLAFKSSTDGLLTLGNNIATIGSIVDELFAALQSLHTEGSPTAHTASTWYAASIAPLKTKWNKVCD